MRAILSSIWILTALAAQAQLPAPLPAPFPDPAVGRIDLFDAGGAPVRAATAFWIAPAEVVTNWHVIRFGRSASVVMPDGTVHRVTHLIGIDERADIVLLRADPPFDGRVFPLTSEPPTAGTQVRIIGRTDMAENPALEGVLVAQRELEFTGPTLIIDMARGIDQGFSGSPVVDPKGRVLGIVNFGLSGKAFGGTAPAIAALRSGVPTPLQDWDHKPRTRHGRALAAMIDALLIEGERLDDAMRMLREVVAESPDCWAAWGHLLSNYKAMGNHEAALEAATKAAAGPTAQHSVSLAALLRAKGRTDEADAAEARAKQIDPTGYAAIQAKERALRAMQEGRYGEAVPGLAVAVNANPGSIELRCSLVQCMASAGQAELALPQADWLIRRAPKLAMAHYSRGVVLACLHRLPQALEEYKTAVELEPRNAAMRLELGQLQARLGNLDAAHQELAALRPLDEARARVLEALIAQVRAGRRP